VDVRPGDEPAFLAPHPLVALPAPCGDPRAAGALQRAAHRHARGAHRAQVEGVLGRRGAVLHACANGRPRPSFPARRESLRAQSTLRVETNDRDLCTPSCAGSPSSSARSPVASVTPTGRARRALRRPPRRRERRRSSPPPTRRPSSPPPPTLADRLLVRRTALSALGLTVLLGSGSASAVAVQRTAFRAAPPVAQCGARPRQTSVRNGEHPVCALKACASAQCHTARLD
jgi:hypothetical protein